MAQTHSKGGLQMYAMHIWMALQLAKQAQDEQWLQEVGDAPGFATIMDHITANKEPWFVP